MPLRPKSRGAGGNGGGVRSLPRQYTPRSSGGSSYTPDEAGLTSLRTEGAIRDLLSGGGDPAAKDLSDRIARLLASPSEKVQKKGVEALTSLGVEASPERLAELGLPVPNSMQNKDSSVKAKVFRGVDEALRFIDRPRQALLEVVQAASEDLGSLDYFSPGASKLNDPGNLSDAAQEVIGEAAGSGGYRDALTALAGNARWDPTTQTRTKNLSFSAALGQDPGQYGNEALGRVGQVAGFTGDVAVDPLNLVGGGTKAGAKTIAEAAAKDVAEAAAREGAEALTPQLAKALTSKGVLTQPTEESVQAALRKIGVRKGLTKAQQEAAVEALRGEGVIRTKGLFSDKVREIPLKGPKRTLGVGTARDGAERTLVDALRYDAGGFRVAGRTVPLTSGWGSKAFGSATELGHVNVAGGTLENAAEEATKIEGQIAKRTDTLANLRVRIDQADDPALIKKLESQAKGTETRITRLTDRLDTLRNAATAEDVAAIDPSLVPVTAPLREQTGGLLGNTGVVDWARKAFVPRSSLKRAESLPLRTAEIVGDAEVTGRALRNSSNRQIAGMAEQAVKAAREELGRTAAVLDDEGKRAITAALEKGGSLDDLTDPVVRGLADKMDEMRRMTHRMLIDEGLADPTKLQEVDDYLRHYLTPEGLDALIKAGNLNVPELVPYKRAINRLASAARQGGSLNKRELFKDMTINEINDTFSPVLQEAGLLKPGKEVMVSDPMEILLRRHGEVTEALESAKTADYIGENLKGIFGQELVHRVRPGTKKPKGLSKDLVKVNVPVDTFGEIYAHPDLADHLAGYLKAVATDEGVEGFRKFLVQWQQMWKAYATVPLVGGSGFHVKNAIGNMANNYLAGVKTKFYGIAFDLQRDVAAAKKAHPELTLPKAMEEAGIASDKIAKVELALERGVIDEGFFSLDVAGNATTDALSGTQSLKGRVGSRMHPLKDPANAFGVRSGRKIGEAIEDNARLAHFLSKLDEFGNADRAARSVKEALFDYGDLTPFEKGVRRYAAAFYTFTRKNTPYILNELSRNPAGINRLAQLESALLGESEGESVPRFAQEMGNPVSKGLAGLLAPGGNQVVANIETPTEAAFKTLDPVIRLAGGKATIQDTVQSGIGLTAGGPSELVKQLYENATDRSSFTGSSLRTPEGDYKVNPLLRLTQAINPIIMKEARLLGVSGGQAESGRLRLIKALTGVSAREVTPEMRDMAKRDDIQSLDKLIEMLEKKGLLVGTVGELQQLGLLQRPQQ